MSAIPKLSPRLEAILSRLSRSAVPHFDHVWDCCCDHGFLGMHIIEQQYSGHLYFVDQLAHITAPLSDDLVRRGFTDYSVLTADCSQLDLSAEGRHLVIIAGVGGLTLVEMLQGIAQRNPGQRLHFLLCAANRVYDLREYLASQPYRLLGEQIVSDRGREYEVIEVQLQANGECVVSSEQVDPVGRMWCRDEPEHLHYQQVLLAHYRRQQRSRDNERLRSIISAYEGCLTG